MNRTSRACARSASARRHVRVRVRPCRRADPGGCQAHRDPAPRGGDRPRAGRARRSRGDRAPGELPAGQRCLLRRPVDRCAVVGRVVVTGDGSDQPRQARRRRRRAPPPCRYCLRRRQIAAAAAGVCAAAKAGRPVQAVAPSGLAGFRRRLETQPAPQAPRSPCRWSPWRLSVGAGAAAAACAGAACFRLEHGRPPRLPPASLRRYRRAHLRSPWRRRLKRLDAMSGDGAAADVGVATGLSARLQGPRSRSRRVARQFPAGRRGFPPGSGRWGRSQSGRGPQFSRS